MEALLNRAELLLWKCRKELYFGKLDELKKKCVKEQDDVFRMEGNLFAKLRRDYEERLEEEKKESFCANLELEQAEKELTEIEEKIALFEGVSSIYNADDLNDAEREMHEWCLFAEQTYEVLVLTNKCLFKGWQERMQSYSNPGNLEKCIAFQEDVEELYRIMGGFLSAVGRVRYLPGIRVKNNALLQRSSRTTYYGGKTFVFLREGYDPVQIDLHELDFKNLWGGWAVGDALERKLKEIEQLRRLFSGIAEESIVRGETMLRKVKMSRFQPAEKDIFGFDKSH